MKYEISQENDLFIVEIKAINLVAKFESITEMTIFIQSMITNVTSY